MATLYMVRHGQASFGADNYDQLSALGQRQCVRLGQYLRDIGRQFEAVLTGSLQRQQQSYAAIAAGLQRAVPPLVWPGLNEYDSQALLATVYPGELARPDTPERYREHFRLLRKALAQWMAGATQPAGMPGYADFVAGVRGALDHVRERHRGDVLIVSSGGPIATAVGQILGTAPEVTIDLNMRIRNSAVTEFAYTPKRHMLLTYNTLPHLVGEEYADWVTYA